MKQCSARRSRNPILAVGSFDPRETLYAHMSLLRIVTSGERWSNVRSRGHAWARSEMTMPARARYAGYRFRTEIIGHAVRLYFRFPLGPRMLRSIPTPPSTKPPGPQPQGNGRALGCRRAYAKLNIGGRRGARNQSLSQRGTGSSNPVPSSGESCANPDLGRFV